MVTESFVDTLEALKEGNFSFFADETTKVCTLSEIESHFKHLLKTRCAKMVEGWKSTDACIEIDHPKLGKPQWRVVIRGLKEWFELHVGSFFLRLEKGKEFGALTIDWPGEDQARIVANRLGLTAVIFEGHLTVRIKPQNN